MILAYAAAVASFLTGFLLGVALTRKKLADERDGYDP